MTKRTIDCPFTGTTIETTDEKLQESFSDIMFAVKKTQAKRDMRAMGIPAEVVDAVEFVAVFS